MATRILVPKSVGLLQRTSAPSSATQLPLSVLSPRLARVLVALDVLDQMRTERLIAGNEGHVAILRSDNSKRYFHFFEDMGQNVDPLAALGRPCRVCAIGAVFVAHARRDGPKLRHLRHSLLRVMHGDWWGLGASFHRIFPRRLLDTIQDCYERWGVNCPMPHVSRSQRLRLIMENIVDNDGHFDPEKLRRKKAA